MSDGGPGGRIYWHNPGIYIYLYIGQQTGEIANAPF